MLETSFKGNYTTSFLSDKPADLLSKEAVRYKNELQLKPNEAVYIYSFRENKMIYADGWKNNMEINNSELNLLSLLTRNTDENSNISKELYDRTLHYLHHHKHIENSYLLLSTSGVINNIKTSYIVKTEVHETDDNGNLVSIITRVTFNNNIKHGKISQYGVFGVNDKEFLLDINTDLENKLSISYIEIEIIRMLNKGMSINDISEKSKHNQSFIKDKIKKLYLRFKVYSIVDLIDFALKEKILPNKLKVFIN